MTGTSELNVQPAYVFEHIDAYFMRVTHWAGGCREAFLSQDNKIKTEQKKKRFLYECNLFFLLLFQTSKHTCCAF